MPARERSVQVTDGYHDMGIDAIYLDEIQKKLFVVQSKWRTDGAGSITQDEMSNFAQGVQRVLVEDLAGANATGLFALEGVSLVNGAQTTGTIGSLFLDNPEQVSKAIVMLQIIDLSSVDTETARQITRLSNTQNRIENIDFAALDPEQDRLRTELTFAHYSYLYKSGDKITNLEKQISFDEAIVALACLNDDVSYAVIAKGNVGALSEDITETPYKALMN